MQSVATFELYQHARQRDPETGALRYPDEWGRVAGCHIPLFDPPVDGATPVDGAGSPRTSLIQAQAVAEALANGFTPVPVGHAPPAVEAEEVPPKGKK